MRLHTTAHEPTLPPSCPGLTLGIGSRRLLWLPRRAGRPRLPQLIHLIRGGGFRCSRLRQHPALSTSASVPAFCVGLLHPRSACVSARSRLRLSPGLAFCLSLCIHGMGQIQLCNPLVVDSSHSHPSHRKCTSGPTQSPSLRHIQVHGTPGTPRK